MDFNQRFEDKLREKGSHYAVGYALGALSVQWHLGPNFIKHGWSFESVCEFMDCDPKDLRAAIDLFGPNDEQATAVLRERVKQLLVRGYRYLFSYEVIESMVEDELLATKDLIRNPNWN